MATGPRPQSLPGHRRTFRMGPHPTVRGRQVKHHRCVCGIRLLAYDEREVARLYGAHLDDVWRRT